MQHGVTPASTSTPPPPLALRAWLRYDVVSRIIARLNPTDVLEIGCGQGAFGARISDRVTYVGVEPDRASYEMAATRVLPRGGHVINGTHEAVPEGSTFDVVCSFEVLEHLQDDAGALQSWLRFLRPGGHVIVSVPAFQERFGPMDTYVGHYRRYSPDELRDRLTSVGLVVEDITVYGWPLGYALEAVRNRMDAKKLAAARAEGTTIEELTAASGRTFQPSRRSMGITVQAASLPFRYLQRLRQDSGIGLVAAGRLPSVSA